MDKSVMKMASMLLKWRIYLSGGWRLTYHPGWPAYLE